MLRLLGNPRQMCNGVTRRDWMQVGGLGMLGLSLADVLRWEQNQVLADEMLPGFGKAKRCILLLPYGSPPQHETFDPKPDAPVEIRGTHNSIPTNIPGVRIDEHLPRISEIMDRITVVRSMTHPYPTHCVAYATSGIPTYTPALETRPRDPKLWPYLGSVVDFVQSRREQGQSLPAVPRNMALPWKMNSRGGEAASVQAGPYAAFLGPAYDPVLTEFEGKASRTIPKVSPNNGPTHQVEAPYAGIEPECQFRLAGARLRGDMTIDRHKRRRSLMKQLEQVSRRIDRNLATDSYDRFEQMANALISSSQVHQALDIQRESMAMRENYGMHLFGQSCLAARRLVEAGSRFVTVFWDEYAYLNTDWDTHWNHYYRLKDRLLPGFDSAYSALLLDLEQRGMLDDTLVVWMSEHGRTPKLNSNKGGGRDHWSSVYCLAMAGGGVKAGEIVGQSDRIGGDVHDLPVSPKDILATIFHLLGIDAHTTIPDRLGRPTPIAGTGKVRPEVIA